MVATKDLIPESCQGVSVDDQLPDPIPVSCQGVSEGFEDLIPVSR